VAPCSTQWKVFFETQAVDGLFRHGRFLFWSVFCQSLGIRPTQDEIIVSRVFRGNELIRYQLQTKAMEEIHTFEILYVRIYGMITNDVSDYINLLVRIAHIICNHSV
jgi:hypothetical protein